MGFDILSVFLLIIGVFMVSAAGQRPRSLEAVQLTASRLGLVAEPGRAAGVCRGFQVSLVRTESGGVEVVIPGLPEALRFERPALLRKAREQDTPIGDPDFDAALIVFGESRVAMTVLGARARARLLRALSMCDGLKAEGGALIARVDDGTGLDRAVEALLDAAEVLRDALSEQRLAINAFEDPCSGVRYRCLSALLSDGMDREALARRALVDRSPRIRILAARVLEEDGWATLRGDMDVEDTLLSELVDRGLNDEVRLAAIAGLERVSSARSWRTIRVLRGLSWSFRVSSAIRRRAASAVRSVEVRELPTGIGAVTLSAVDEVAGGSVSLVEGEGAISLADERG